MFQLLCIPCIILYTNIPCYGHRVEKVVPNNTSPPAIFVWHDGQWHIKVPWVGKGLPLTMTCTCSIHKKTLTMRKYDYFFIGEMEPSHIGYEGEEVSIGFNFYAIYEGECPETNDESSSEEYDFDEEEDYDDDYDTFDDNNDFDDFDNDYDKSPEWSINLEGSWNQWGNDFRFMGYEKIRITIENISNIENVNRVEIRLSPELESMTYRNAEGNRYDYHEEFGYTVDFPLLAEQIGDRWSAEYILPVAPSTISWANEELSDPYQVEVMVFYDDADGGYEETLTQELNITGNINDLLYIRPIRDF